MPNVFVLKNNGMGPDGFLKLELHAYQNKNYLGSITVRSGLAGRQRLSTVKTEHVGQYEPCPEGEYDLGNLQWASGKQGDYSKLFPEVKSPIWVDIYRKRVIGFHFDGGVPGSAGCLVFKTMDDLKQFVNWYNGYGHFSKLYVDYGLGHVRVPAEYKNAGQPPAAAKPPKKAGK